jgi:excisionase family DNA binding protein
MNEEFLDLIKIFLKPIFKEVVVEVQAEKIPQVDEKRLTRKQLCERWNITLPTLSNYVHDGKITPIKIGRRVLFSENEILRAESAGVGKYRHINNK